MEVLLFGESSQPLLGVYHPANADLDLRRGVVFCSPFGQEYMRSHRAFRVLADALAMKGYHVLRFDYRGTGDSAGSLDQFSPKDWLDDIDAAMDELRELAAIERVGLLGLRLGALLAYHVALRRRGVDVLALWDPVLSGESYLSELRREIDREPGHHAIRSIATNGDIHFNGFCLDVAFQLGLRELDIDSAPSLLSTPILHFASHTSPASDGLRSMYATRDNYSYRYTPAPHDWNRLDGAGGILLPQAILSDLAAAF